MSAAATRYVMEHKMIAKKQSSHARGLETRRRICTAFLELKRTRSFTSITVAELCRQAQISRGTFYHHYASLSDVLDDVLDDVFRNASPLPCGLLGMNAPGSARPLCALVRGNEKLRGLFCDSSLTRRIIERLLPVHVERLGQWLGPLNTLPDDQLRSLAIFQLGGCLTLMSSTIGMPECDWALTQQVVDRFIAVGYGERRTS